MSFTTIGVARNAGRESVPGFRYVPVGGMQRDRDFRPRSGRFCEKAGSRRNRSGFKFSEIKRFSVPP